MIPWALRCHGQRLPETDCRYRAATIDKREPLAHNPIDRVEVTSLDLVRNRRIYVTSLSIARTTGATYSIRLGMRLKPRIPPNTVLEHWISKSGTRLTLMNTDSCPSRFEVPAFTTLALDLLIGSTQSRVRGSVIIYNLVEGTIAARRLGALFLHLVSIPNAALVASTITARLRLAVRAGYPDMFLHQKRFLYGISVFQIIYFMVCKHANCSDTPLLTGVETPTCYIGESDLLTIMSIIRLLAYSISCFV